MRIIPLMTVTAALMLCVSACGAGDPNPEGTAAKDGGVEAAETGSTNAGDPVELIIHDIEDAIVDSDSFGGKDWAASIDGAVLVYESAGSGSCKPIIESAVLDGNTITLTRFDYRGRPCTMDLRHYKQEITRPGGGEFPEDVEINVVDPNAIM